MRNAMRPSGSGEPRKPCALGDLSIELGTQGMHLVRGKDESSRARADIAVLVEDVAEASHAAFSILASTAASAVAPGVGGGC
jgi:hypothetical protein